MRDVKTQCLLRRNRFHTTAWMDARTIKLGVVVEIAELGGLWEIVEIYPSIDRQTIKNAQDPDTFLNNEFHLPKGSLRFTGSPSWQD